MGTNNQVECLDIFETQKVLELIWDYHETHFPSTSKKSSEILVDHNDAKIKLWCSYDDISEVDRIYIKHKDFSICGIWADDFFFNYWGDRQELAEWLLEWKLRM